MQVLAENTDESGMEIVQLSSVGLFDDVGAMGLVNCYNAFVLVNELEKNVFVPVDQLQKKLLEIQCTKQELEKRILLNVCHIAKKDSGGRLYEVFKSIIKSDTVLLKEISTNNQYLAGSLVPKIRKLKEELEDTEFPLSQQGRVRLNGFLEYFTELQKSLELDKNLKVELSPTHQLEIREYVIREFVSRCSDEQLMEILLISPKIEGLHARDILMNPSTSMGIPTEQAKRCIFYLGCDFSMSNILTVYPFELLFDKKKELMLNISHFLSITATYELNLVLSRYLLELLLGFRSHVILQCRKELSEPSYITVIIRKKERSDGVEKKCPIIQMLVVDPENENMLTDLNNEKLHTNVLHSLIKPIQEFANDVFSKKEQFDFSASFLKDLEIEFEEREEEKNELFDAKKISEGIKRSILGGGDVNHLQAYQDPSDRSPIHIFFEQWKRFLEKGEVEKSDFEFSQTFDENTPFFVYGTLRPDSDRKHGWCKSWNDNEDTPLRNRKGYIKKHDLYLGKYPFVLKNGNGHEDDWKTHVVFGYVQDFEPKVSKELYMQKLSELDMVEGYPNFYQRKIVKVFLINEEEEEEGEGKLDSSFDKEKITGEEESVGVHLYYLKKDCFSDSKIIHSGDYIAETTKKDKN